MAIVNGQNVNKVAIGGEVFVKKLIGSRITIPTQTHLYASEDLDDVTHALGTTSVITSDCTATVIGIYYPSQSWSHICTVQVEGIPSVYVTGGATSGWIEYDNLKSLFN